MTRSPSLYLAIIEGLHVTTSQKYHSGFLIPGATWCNRFVSDATAALGCAVPFMLANEMVEKYLAGDGKRDGWAELTPVGAQSASSIAAADAKLGLPVVAGYVNLHCAVCGKLLEAHVGVDHPFKDGHGHVAMVVPSEKPGTWIAQAGAMNYDLAPISWGFGAIEPRFFVHP